MKTHELHRLSLSTALRLATPSSLAGLATLAVAVTVAITVAGPVAAQSSASTLPRLTDTASTIAEVKVLANRVQHDQRVVTLKRTRVWKGGVPATFVLREHAGRACGNTLFSLLPGSSVVAFLDTKGANVRLALPSPRALVPAHGAVREQVSELLTAPAGPRRIRVLTSALTSVHPRVREDAALALALATDLPQANRGDRNRILAALTKALDGGERSSTGLLQVVRRLALEEAASSLLPRYLNGRRPELDPLLVPVLAELDAAGVVDSLRKTMPRTPSARRRAVTLLASCNTPGATNCLQHLLQQSGHSVRVQAAVALLQRGVSPQVVQEHGGAEVLKTSQQLLQTTSHPGRRFRSIRPSTSTSTSEKRR